MTSTEEVLVEAAGLTAAGRRYALATVVLDEELLAAALDSGARYVGLIASARRATVVVERLRARGLGEERLARIRSPAGLDLGSGGQEEIAVAILAELVACFHTGIAGPEAEAVDPVCGMTVATTGAVETAVHQGLRYWFCAPGCLGRFRSDPEHYLAVAAAAQAGSPDESSRGG